VVSYSEGDSGAYIIESFLNNVMPGYINAEGVITAYFNGLGISNDPINSTATDSCQFNMKDNVDEDNYQPLRDFENILKDTLTSVMIFTQIVLVSCLLHLDGNISKSHKDNNGVRNGKNRFLVQLSLGKNAHLEIKNSAKLPEIPFPHMCVYKYYQNLMNNIHHRDAVKKQHCYTLIIDTCDDNLTAHKLELAISRAILITIENNTNTINSDRKILEKHINIEHRNKCLVSTKLYKLEMIIENSKLTDIDKESKKQKMIKQLKYMNFNENDTYFTLSQKCKKRH
jgi:hypothetical protein